MHVQPYLNFDGHCDEAIEFYKKALGAKVEMLMRYKDCPEGECASQFPPEMGTKVMHSTLRIGDSVMNASDGRCQGKTTVSGISLSLGVDDDAEAERVFAALGEGGKVGMPMGKTFFSSRFGMVTDRFGIMWMVLVQK